VRLSLSVICSAAILAVSAIGVWAGPQFGNPAHGAALIRQVGCGSCHIIPGIKGARGLAGPPLDHMSRRIFIAGMLRNTPENMRHWIMHPQAVIHGNAMPEMGLSQTQATDIAAYLATLK
jgi:cytochrome c2